MADKLTIHERTQVRHITSSTQFPPKTIVKNMNPFSKQGTVYALSEAQLYCQPATKSYCCHDALSLGSEADKEDWTTG
jgi:hypothetical protein